MNQFLVFPLLAFFLTIALHLIVLKVFPTLNLLDFPERYGLKRKRIPYPTGIISVLCFLSWYITLTTLGTKEIGVIVAVALLAITATTDDIRPLPFSLRLGMQCTIALLLFVTGSRIYTITHPFGGFIKLDALNVMIPNIGTLPILSGMFTLIWLLLTINALNWFDGIPGQVSIVSSIGFFILGWLAVFRVQQPDIGLIAFILMAISLGAMLFDFPPPKVLMGDSGSMFFGLMLGLLGIYHGGKVATTFVILGIPLIDAVFVIIRRAKKKTSPFRGDQDHLHHRLLKKGWSDKQIVMMTALIGGTFGGTALFLDTKGKGVEIIALFCLLLLLSLYSGTKEKEKKNHKTNVQTL